MTKRNQKAAKTFNSEVEDWLSEARHEYAQNDLSNETKKKTS